ncbi:MAG: two-component regulator propeller domain-containing protein [Ekhidna sp.]
MRILLILPLFLLALFSTAQPNRFRFHSYGLEEGLTSNSINTMAEDAHGFIWVGSNDGLFRFDAYSFKPYFRSKSENLGLVGNSITEIHALSNGDLLIGTRQGVSYFNSKKELFTRVWKNHDLGYVSKIIHDEDGWFWVATRNGLFRLSLGTEKFRVYTNEEKPNSLSANGIFDALIDSKGRFWVSTSNGLNLYQEETDDFRVYQYDDLDRNSISSNVLRQLEEAPDGRILVGTATEGLNILEPSTGVFKRYTHNPSDPNSLSTNSAYSILVDSNENIWVGTWSNGLNLFDINTGKALRYTYNPNDLYSIPHNSVKSIMESSSGDIWIATDDGGIARMSPRQEQIVRYRHDSRNSNSIGTNYVRAVYEDSEGVLWIGTAQSGLYAYDRNLGQFQVFLKPDESRRSKARGSAWSIAEGENGILWLGTGIGLGKLDRRTGKIKFYEPDETNRKSISTNNVLEVLDDGKGNVWLGTWSGGLNKFNKSTEEFEAFYNDESDENSLAGNTVTFIHQDGKGRLWVEANGFLHLVDEESMTFTRFDLGVNSIVEDEMGDFWIASDDGLIKFDTKELVHARIVHKASEVLDDSFYTIERDLSNRIWLGSPKGVICYDPSLGEVVGKYDKKSGLAGNNISPYVSDFGQRSEKLFFGGPDGLSEIDPTIVSLKEAKFNTVFTDFLLFNKSVEVSDSTVLTEGIHAASSVTLDYNDYIFAFEFAALNFGHPEKISYAYKLEGFDNDWIITDHLDRKAVYTNVPAGRYTFKVKSSAPNGYWLDEKAASIQLSIIPPWWQTWWAYAIFLLSVLFAIVLIFRIRTTLLRNQKRLLEIQVEERSSEVVKQKEELEVKADELRKINEQKNKLFSIIAHDLKTPLNTIESVVPLIDPKILDSQNLEKIKQSINEQVSSVSSAMENLLVWAKSQLEGEIIQKSHFSLADVIHQKMTLFMPYAESKKIQLKTSASNKLTVFADENQVRAILRNLIGNALKFTKAGGSVTIHAATDDTEVKVSIADSGIGIAKDKIDGLFNVKMSASVGTGGEKGVGLGLLVVKDFVEKNGGTISVESIVGKGTTFHFNLPKDKS